MAEENEPKVKKTEKPAKMVKVRVKSTYRDKNTNEIVKAGTFIEVTQARYKELAAKGKVVKA